MKPSQVHGLPQPTDAFPRRFRNKYPLILRQIVAPSVLEQWSSHPEHVVQALNQTASTGAGAGVEVEEEPLLGVMVAEDTKNFMDNPQFTRKVDMTAREIVARVLSIRSVEQEEQITTMMEVVVPQLEVQEEEEEEEEQQQQQAQEEDFIATEVVVPTLSSGSSSQLSLVSTATSTTATTGQPTCPLCENQDTTTPSPATVSTTQNRRFYYRGMVPTQLYDSLNIPALLTSLSLPTETTPFSNAPNKDLMRIWVSLAGATTPLHYDRCHGILIQLVGRKRFVVFSHEDTHGLYPYDGLSGPGHASKVRALGHCFPLPSLETKDADANDIEYLQHLEENMAEVQRRWPKIRNTTPWIVDLGPGDALYTPPGFWHEVTSVDHSISITVPWDMDADELQSVPRHMI
jgi:hypothetical protein